MAQEGSSHNVSLPSYYPGKKEVLTNIVDFMAKNHPQALFAEFPVSPTSYDAGFHKITYGSLANAVNAAAWWLHESLGGTGSNFETIGYMGVNDPRYNIMVLAAVKAGYKLFLSSPRNSSTAHAHLFSSLGCKTLIVTDPTSPMFASAISSQDLNVLKVPGIHELLDGQTRPYPYNKTWEEAKDDPLLALHTSGSTGIPKALIWTHDFAAAFYNMSQLDPPAGYESQNRLYQDNRIIFFFPPFHGAALFLALINGIANRSVWIYPPAAGIPSAKLLVDGLKHTKADVLAIPPPVVVDLARQPDLVEETSSKIDTIIFGGGDVPEAIGSALKDKFKMVSVLGATEIGLAAAIRPAGKFPSDDWQYIHFHPEFGTEFKHINADLYELHFIRSPEIFEHQPMFKLFPELQEYNTRDLFTPHPSKPDLWIYRGRSDDIIVFLTGEKTNPTSFEHHVATHPGVKAALVIGTQRFQAGLLIELVEEGELSSTERAKIIEGIWPKIHEANQVCPNHAIVAKTHVLLVNPKKPMARAGKGTVQRQLTLSTYAEEIDALYADAEKMNATSDDVETLDGEATVEKLSLLVEKFVKKQTGWADINAQDNLYLLGLDSLQTLLLVRDLKQAVGLPDLAPSSVYTNPSITELSNAILNLLNQKETSTKELDKNRRSEIESLILEHSNAIDEFASTINTEKESSNNESSPDHVVLLTGSTGSLGTYLLQALLKNPTVSHVYCLNRSPDSSSVQVERNKSRGIEFEFPENRVTFLCAKPSEENFGLDPQIYDKLSSTVTEIILNGWTVNFNIPLSTFNQQLSGVVNFSKFASQARYNPSVLFISSISSVIEAGAVIPENVIRNHSAPLPMGYGESKYIAELLLDHVAQRLFVDARIARVGQIAGPAHISGTWNRWEWLPSLVISSLHIGALPGSLGDSMSTIDWVPIDILADVLVELSFSNKSTESSEKTASVYHPQNPSTISWTELLPTIVATLSKLKGAPVEVITLHDWLKRIHADVESGGSDIEELVKRNPAVKLLGTYEVFAKEQGEGTKFTTDRAQAASAKLKSCEAIRPEWVDKWCQGWFKNE
ncbi:hypothetical protein HYFRA_00006542 [Hymenoscyphus fraxineus]|uniref:Carrier domain-containing protein n=1 Tax=Hymenoscyphus fraxineus TaxID=746836 RepID=A0A9N9KPK2_9HELO|nr:hypothetical protein HYFRA_00006542 [Hymenoscyphus fraxineus]